MVTLSGTILMLMVSILIGKHAKRLHLAAYATILFLTLVEVGLVLYQMYTMPIPKP